MLAAALRRCQQPNRHAGSGRWRFPHRPRAAARYASLTSLKNPIAAGEA